MSIDQQLKLLQFIDKEMFNKFIFDNNFIYCESKLPDGINMSINNIGYCLRSNKNFNIGDIVFQNDSIIYDHNKYKILFKLPPINDSDSICSISLTSVVNARSKTLVILSPISSGGRPA